MAFVQSALVRDESSLRQYARDVEGRDTFLNLGLDNESAVSALPYVDNLFVE